MASGAAWVIENVPGATMRVDFKLCGCQLGLWRLGRERWFETSWHGFDLRAPCYHPESLVEVYGGGGRSMGTSPNAKGTKAKGTVADRRRAMGIDWMTRDELSQAIPPAYTQYIGEQLRDVIG
jgi:DNA (cytosine-5)-methyltransferase 1